MTAKFIRIILSDNSQVDLTDDHLIYSKIDGILKKIPAEEVKIGNQILAAGDFLTVIRTEPVFQIPISPQESLIKKIVSKF